MYTNRVDLLLGNLEALLFYSVPGQQSFHFLIEVATEMVRSFSFASKVY